MKVRSNGRGFMPASAPGWWQAMGRMRVALAGEAEELGLLRLFAAYSTPASKPKAFTPAD